MKTYIVEVLCHIPYDGCHQRWHYFVAGEDDDGKITGVIPIFHPHQRASDDYYDLTPERLAELLAGGFTTRNRIGAFNFAQTFTLGDDDEMRRLEKAVPVAVMPAILKAFDDSEYDDWHKPWFRCSRCGATIHESDDAHLTDYSGDGHGVMYLPNGILCTDCCERSLVEEDPDDHEG